MYTSIEFPGTLLHVDETYTVVRRTHWEVVDTRHTLILVDDGTAYFTIGTEHHTAHKGDLLFVPANSKYSRDPIDQAFATFSYIHFSTPMQCLDILNGQQLLKQIGASPSKYFYIPSRMCATSQIIELFRHIVDLHSGLITPVPCLVELNLQQLLLAVTCASMESLCMTSEHVPNSLMLNSSNIRTAIRFIHNNYNRKIDLTTLCALCNVSEQQLIRLFRKETGTTPLQYINDYRILRAKMIIRNNTDLSVNEVADLLGFLDTNYFSRLFYKKTGVSPSSFKKHVIETESGRKG